MEARLLDENGRVTTIESMYLNLVEIYFTTCYRALCEFWK